MRAPKISLEEVQKVARLARLASSDDEVERFQRDLDAILGYVTVLDALDTSGVEPTAHPLTLASPLRPDIVSEGLAPADALAAAPASREGGFAVPKVIEVES